MMDGSYRQVDLSKLGPGHPKGSPSQTGVLKNRVIAFRVVDTI